jgi:uncharacterized protein YciI
MKFLIYYSHGDAWIKGKPTNEQSQIFQHAIYIQNLFNEGKIILADPFDDHTGGASIIEVSNEEEAREVMNNDPIDMNNTVTARLGPWQPQFNIFENFSPNYNREFFSKRGINI